MIEKMSKSFLIDAIMQEEDYIYHKKKHDDVGSRGDQRETAAIITSMRVSSPLSDRSSSTPSQLSPTDNSVSRYSARSPGASPRTPPILPLTIECLHEFNASMSRQRLATSLYNIRTSPSSLCGCCPQNSLSPVCSMREHGPREGEAAPSSQKLYQYSTREDSFVSPRSNTAPFGNNRNERIFSMVSPISSRPRPQFSPIYGKLPNIISVEMWIEILNAKNRKFWMNEKSLIFKLLFLIRMYKIVSWVWNAH